MGYRVLQHEGYARNQNVYIVAKQIGFKLDLDNLLYIGNNYRRCRSGS
jgi:hypothetical protein